MLPALMTCVIGAAYRARVGHGEAQQYESDGAGEEATNEQSQIRVGWPQNYYNCYLCPNMAYCSSCGAEVEAGAAFCSECGEELQTGTASGTDEPETADPDTSEEWNDEDLEAKDDGIDWKHAGIAALFGLVPAFIAYMMVTLATGGDPVGIVFLLAIPVFAYLLYSRTTPKQMAGGTCYYLAIEFLLSPFVFLLYTFAFASQNTTTDAGAAGAAIGGFALTIGAFVIGLPLALALYLISRRLDPERGSSSGGDTAAAA